MTYSEYDLVALLETAEESAVAAGELAIGKLYLPKRQKNKGFRDIVTEVDFEAQKVITDLVASHFPDHGFITEEKDRALPAAGDVIWIIDPIDGTTNFSRQIPEFCVSVAAVSADAGLLAGAIYDPVRRELFSGARGAGSKVNGSPMRVNDLHKMHGALVGIDWSHSDEMRQMTLDALQEFAHQVNTIRAIGSAALALAWVAAGRLDAYLNYNLKAWDVAAGALLIDESGGRLTDVSNNRWHWQSHPGGCVASNGYIHQEFLSLISGIRLSRVHG